MQFNGKYTLTNSNCLYPMYWLVSVNPASDWYTSN